MDDNKEEGDSNDKDEKEEKYKEGNKEEEGNDKQKEDYNNEEEQEKICMCFRHIRSLICSFSWVKKAFWCFKADVCVVSAGSVSACGRGSVEVGNFAGVPQHHTPLGVGTMMICSRVINFCNAAITSLLVECVTFPAKAKMTELVKLSE